VLSCCLFLALFFNLFERLRLSTSDGTVRVCVGVPALRREFLIVHVALEMPVGPVEDSTRPQTPRNTSGRARAATPPTAEKKALWGLAVDSTMIGLCIG